MKSRGRLMTKKTPIEKLVGLQGEGWELLRLHKDTMDIWDLFVQERKVSHVICLASWTGKPAHWQKSYRTSLKSGCRPGIRGRTVESPTTSSAAGKAKVN